MHGKKLGLRKQRSFSFFLLLVIAMVVGLLFLIATIGLLAWRYLVGPVPLALAYVTIGLGAVAGTVILVSALLYALAEHDERR